MGRTLEQISKDRRKAGIKGGGRTYELGVGIFGRSPKQKIEDGKKAGKRVYELGNGIFRRTLEQHSQDGKKGALARGQTPWKDKAIFTKNKKQYHINYSEKDLALRLSELPEYQRGQNINAIKIAKELNSMYHNRKKIRTIESVKSMMPKLKKD